MSNRRAVWEAFRALPGPKTTLYGFRFHHGLFGVQLIVLGALLAWHDWADRSDWFRGRWT